MMKSKQAIQTGLKKEESEQQGVGSESSMIAKMLLLQKTVGNKEVENLIHSGQFGMAQQQAAVKDVDLPSSQKEEEEKQILEDRLALAVKIKDVMQQKKEELNDLVDRNFGRDIYVNVTTELHYVTIVSKDSHEEYYHYTDLVDVDYSMVNTNMEGSSHSSGRKRSATIIFSFLFQDRKYPGLLAKKLEEEEEEVKEEEVDEIEEVDEEATEDLAEELGEGGEDVANSGTESGLEETMKETATEGSKAASKIQSKSSTLSIKKMGKQVGDALIKQF